MDNNTLRQNPVTPFHVLIVAAGRGTRLGGDMPKQYQLLNNKPLLRHTVEAFYGMPTILSLSVVIAPEHATLYEQAVSGLNLQPPVHGGAQRSESVYKGLLALPHPGEKDVVLIHDAARPFVMACDIARVAEAAARYGAATLAAPVSDTLRRGDGTYIDRDDLWAVQTPQGFHYGLLRRAHEAADKEHTATDDTGLVARLGHDVKTVEGNHRNIKITTADDMIFARQLLGAPETRTGFGYDVHAFGPSGSGPVRLCGLDIPHEYGLKGHSDADVGLHALTDAILGALSLGDIGQHFPPTDPQWKGAASEIFLKHAVNMTRAQGGRIVHMDVTLICEAPKIGPHRAAMQERIAAICGLAPDRVSVKATTTEGLGFTGRREGIAAQAVATLELPRGSEI